MVVELGYGRFFRLDFVLLSCSTIRTAAQRGEALEARLANPAFMLYHSSDAAVEEFKFELENQRLRYRLDFV